MKYAKIVFLVTLTCLATMGISAQDVEALRFADDMMRLTGMDKQIFETQHVDWGMPKMISVGGKQYDFVEYKWCVAKFVNAESKEMLSFYLETQTASTISELLYGIFLSMAHSSMPGTVEEKAARMQICVVDSHTLIIPSKRGTSAQILFNDLSIYVAKTKNAVAVARAILEAGLKQTEEE